MNDLAEELTCPITRQLPVNPVIAQDGFLYERDDINEWLCRNKRSPMTNEDMGSEHLPAKQARNVIRKLVGSGAVRDDICASRRQVDGMMKRAEEGHPKDIYNTGICYYTGKGGMDKDLNKAISWFRRGAELDDTHCLTALVLR